MQAYLRELGVPFVVSPSLVRGLDYYTRTVFEIVDASGALGAQDTLCGGGRYDALFTELGSGAPVPAIGFAMGIERLLLSAPKAEETAPFRVAVVAAAKADEGAVHAGVLALAKELRAHGVTALVDTRFLSMKSQMRRADDLGATVVLVVGGNELANGTVTAKRMATGQQETLPRAQCIHNLATEALGTS